MDFRISSPAHTGIAAVAIGREAFVELFHEVNQPVMEQPEACEKTRIDGDMSLGVGVERVYLYPQHFADLIIFEI
jgi:hypothetical protein